MEVRSFKLCTGEELIAQLIEETGLGYKIKNPLVVHMMRTPEGGANLGFAQWSMLHTKDTEITVYYHGLAAEPVQVLAEVESSYITNVSGIAIPPAATGRILHG